MMDKKKTYMVDIENVVFNYSEEKSILKGFNLKVEAGEILGLLGENGSGKTTTFKLLSGLLTPDEGSINVVGKSMFDNRKEILKKTAYLPDESLLYPQFSAMENMNMFAMLWGMEAAVAKKNTEVLLKDVGLWDVKDQWVKSFSKGIREIAFRF